MSALALRSVDFDPIRDKTYTFWEATCAVRDRDNGGPNRRRLERTGRGYCPDCSLRLEHDVPQKEAL